MCPYYVSIEYTITINTSIEIQKAPAATVDQLQNLQNR